MIYNPDELFGRLREKEFGFKIPLILVGIAMTVSVIISYAIADPYAKAVVDALSQSTPMSKEESEMMYTITYYSILATPAIIIPISWIVISGIFQVISYFFDGKGNFTTTLKFTSFGYVPTIVLSPINYLISLETAKFISVQGFNSLTTGVGFEQTAISIFTLMWQITIWTFAIKHAREISTSRAFITAVIPGGILIAMSLLSIVSTGFVKTG